MKPELEKESDPEDDDDDVKAAAPNASYGMKTKAGSTLGSAIELGRDGKMAGDGMPSLGTL